MLSNITGQIECVDGRRQLCCGPLSIRLHTADGELLAQAINSLALISAPWEPPYREVDVVLQRSALHCLATGTFLHCGRMNVDAQNDRMWASTENGLSAQGYLEQQSENWTINVPNVLFTEEVIGDLEDLLSVILTTGWRRAGWVPMHAAAIEKDERCAMLCAPSGGGKSTLTTALARNGWRILGDDKLLLKYADEVATVAALLHTFNLHPDTKRWFADIANLEKLPRYSAYTEKRRIALDQVPGGCALSTARLTHVIQLLRTNASDSVSVTTLPCADILPAMLRQIVIPNDRLVARSIVQTVAKAASGMKGSCVVVGKDAYHNADWLRKFEECVMV